MPCAARGSTRSTSSRIRTGELDLRVSSGTYVRAIAHALGGHCATLRRTEIGPFRVEEADPERVIPPDDALARLEARGRRRRRRRSVDLAVKASEVASPAARGRPSGRSTASTAVIAPC